MKKALVLILSLCLMCSAAFAGETIVLNWDETATEEVAGQGEFQQIEIPDVAKVSYWIPSVMKAEEDGVEGEFLQAATYTTEDNNYRVTVIAFQVNSMEQYAADMKDSSIGSNFVNLTINGVDCIGFEMEEYDIETLMYPVTDNVVLSVNCIPLNGDEDWDAVKQAIFASIRPVE